MTGLENVIAWLVPTARGTSADKATHMAENFFRTVPITNKNDNNDSDSDNDDTSSSFPSFSSSSTSYLSSRLPNLIASRPDKALQLTFDQTPKRPGRFVLGTDPRSCDVILPSLPGVARQHCSLSFDAESRLVLEDFSESGTQVWYDWESVGDKKDYTWVLCSAPGSSQRITVDIQGLRFRVILNDNPARDLRVFEDKVENFCRLPSWTDGLSAGWDRASVAPVLPLFAAEPLFRHIFVKGLVADEPRGEIYLWNMSRPWEPMVKAAAVAA